MSDGRGRVLVTGASRGLGRELARLWAARRWQVLGLVRDRAAADALAAEGCLAVVGDVTDPAVEAVLGDVLARHVDALDVLVNNAGQLVVSRGLERASPQELEALFAVHVAGVLRVTAAALPWLRRAPRPLVVNISSRKGSIARTLAGEGGDILSYGVAKAAQNMLSAAMDSELRRRGIRVLAVHPGRLLTDVAPADADLGPGEAARRLAAWIESVDDATPCGLHDTSTGRLLPW